MLLEVLDICFSYNSHPVLKEVSFKVNQSEIVCLLGENGAGKSTLLKCINRLLLPFRGVVLINQKDISSLSKGEIAKRFAYVPQNTSLSELTVYETILLGRKPYFNWRVNKQDYEIVDEIIKELSLEHLVMKPLSKLSGGERQKVIIARALAQYPKVLLLDEPTSNLDLKNQFEIMSLLKGS